MDRGLIKLAHPDLRYSGPSLIGRLRKREKPD